MLEAAAAKIRKKAYAPYSNFSVGAALRGKSGKIHLGVNVENASFGLTVCAERNAVAAAVAAGEKQFTALAIASGSTPPAAPCGACRQVLSEFAPALPVVLVGGKGEAIESDLATLLPRQFRLKNRPKNRRKNSG